MSETPEILAEKSVLGAALLDWRALYEAGFLAPEDFGQAVHREIWAGMRTLAETGKPVDTVTLGSLVPAAMAYLADLGAVVSTADNVAHHARRVQDSAVRRRLVQACRQAIAEAEEASTAAEVVAALSGKLMALDRPGRSGPQTMRALVADLLPRLEERYEAKQAGQDGVLGLTTGLEDLDAMTGGLRKSRLYIVAARPGQGKTALGIGIAEHVANSLKLPVLVVSAEMSGEEIAERALSAAGCVDSMHLRSGTLRDDEWAQIGAASSRIANERLCVADASSPTLLDIRASYRRAQATNKGKAPALIVVDYLGLCGTSSRWENRNQALGEISRGLKAIAKDLDVPVLALAQLNRGPEKREDKRPHLADIRDCLPGGALVLDAESGQRVPIRNVQVGTKVWALDGDLKLVKRPVLAAWSAGEKAVFRVTTRTGRVLRCTDGHRLLTTAGWRPLREIGVGASVALPRAYRDMGSGVVEMTPDRATLLGWLLGDGYLGGTPTLTVATSGEADVAAALAVQTFGLVPTVKRERDNTPAMRVIMTTGRRCGAGKNPLTTWLRGLGVWGLRGKDKHIPDAVFSAPREIAASVLRGLFHADGSFSVGKSRSTVRLCSISERMVRDAQHLLLRLGIVSTVTSGNAQLGGFRTSTGRMWTLAISARLQVEAFMLEVGFLANKGEKARLKLLGPRKGDSGRIDRLPLAVNDYVAMLRIAAGLRVRDLVWVDQGKRMSRISAMALAVQLADAMLLRLAHSDVLWDEVESIVEDGHEETFDITVDGEHSFCVDDFITHNSGEIENDADLVGFLFHETRPGGCSDCGPGIAEIIVAKHRAGPTGVVHVRWTPRVTRFDNVRQSSSRTDWQSRAEA